MTKLIGAIKKLFYSNPDSPFMAGILDQEGLGGSARFRGSCFAAVGDMIELTGEWVNDAKYGMQFNAESGKVIIDESPEGLIEMIAANKDFKGVGPVNARKIVEAAVRLTFSGSVADTLACQAPSIAAESGVSLKIVSTVSDTWRAQSDFFSSMATLTDCGWSASQATKLIERYGASATSVASRDPYGLIGRIPRFGFKTVDAVAKKMGVKSDDEMRLSAGVAYCLDSISDNGNTWTSREALLDNAVEELRPDTLDGEDKARDAIETLISTGLVRVMTLPNGTEVVSSGRISDCEIAVFERLMRGLKTQPGEDLSFNAGGSLDVVLTLNTGQHAAMCGFKDRLTSVICGGAGVGKTYMARAVCDVAEANGLVIKLCAPSGKAARRLSHATNREASTIHKLLEPQIDPKSGGFTFSRGKGNKLEVDLVVIDEMSMTDVTLMHALLSAIPEGCRILLVGDHHQIPSVGPGAILRDLISVKEQHPEGIHVLDEIVRQAGILARNTAAICDGVVPPGTHPAWGVSYTERGKEPQTAKDIATLVEAMVTAPDPLEPFGRHLDFAWDVQVLSPMRKGPLGTWALNVHLQKLRQRLLGNPQPEITKEGRPPKPLLGDRIIWTKNDYELDLFNGTQAIVRGFSSGDMKILTEDGRELTVPSSKRDRVEVAYAMTIHKSQGSEWPCVILAIASSHWIMRDRNLIYTGVSRASESVTVVGDRKGIHAFAKEKRSDARQTLGSFIVRGWTPS